jgi:ABC-type ATPase involved in cell division
MSEITKLEVENFTAFRKLSLNLSPGINVFIGTNGTGKTHLLKLLYSACAITEGQKPALGVKLRDVFKPYEGRLGRLARRQPTSATVKLTIFRRGDLKLTASFSNHTDKPESMKTTGETRWREKEAVAAFIPVKEMLAHAPGFRSLYAKRDIAFEETYADIVDLAFLPKLMGQPEKDRARLLKTLEKAIQGKVIAKGEHFFLKNKQGELEFTLLAEGMRKLALIWLLIQNGTLLGGSVLFWDEPESNLNPSLMREVVTLMLELQRMGVQMFLATHNYVLLKEFDLQREAGDQLLFHALARDDESGDISCYSTPDHDALSPNALVDTMLDLYERDIARDFKDSSSASSKKVS